MLIYENNAITKNVYYENYMTNESFKKYVCMITADNADLCYIHYV